MFERHSPAIHDLLGDRRLVSADQLDALDEEHRAAAALSIEAVPAVVLLGRDGDLRQRIDGFDRAGWQLLFERLITHALAPAPLVDWAAFPASLPATPVAR